MISLVIGLAVGWVISELPSVRRLTFWLRRRVAEKLGTDR